MTYGARSLLAPAMMILCLTGCDSNQRGDAPTESAAGLGEGTAVPSLAADSAGAAVTPGTPATQANGLPPAAQTGGDCFVYADAEPAFGEAPLTTHFTSELECASPSVTYSWDFGDGTNGGNEANPTHVYAKGGDYVATITITTPEGAKGSDEVDIYVDEKD